MIQDEKDREDRKMREEGEREDRRDERQTVLIQQLKDSQLVIPLTIHLNHTNCQN